MSEQRSAAERGPGTAAGEELLASIYILVSGKPDVQEVRDWSRERILAIEAEATAAVPLDVERLAEALANLDVDGESTPVEIRPYTGDSSDNYMEHRLGAAQKIADAYARIPARLSADEEGGT